MLLPNRHRHALHTGSSTPGFHCDADPNPKQVLRMVHAEKEVLRDLAFSALRIRRVIRSPPLFFYLVFLLTCWNQLFYAVIWDLHLLIHTNGNMQKCCRTVGTSGDPSELIQQRKRARCTAVLLPLFRHCVCLHLASLFLGFLQNNVNLSRTRDLWILKSRSVLGRDTAWLVKGSREGVE